MCQELCEVLEGDEQSDTVPDLKSLQSNRGAIQGRKCWVPQEWQPRRDEGSLTEGSIHVSCWGRISQTVKGQGHHKEREPGEQLIEVILEWCLCVLVHGDGWESTGEAWLRSTVWVEHTHSSVKSRSQSPSFLSSHIMELENWNISFPCDSAWAARAKESKEECKLMKVVGKHLKSRQPVLTCSSWASSPHFFLLQSTCHYLWKQQPSWHCETLQEWGYVCGMAEEKARNLLLPQWHHLATVSPPPHMPCAWKKKKNSYLSKVTVSQIFFSSQLNKMPTYKPYVRNTACHSREIKVYSIRKKEAESTLHRN